MSHTIITVKSVIYSLEITTPSNNHLMHCLCLDCLSRAKTNGYYREIKTFPLISNNRVCANCKAMTSTAIYAVFAIPLIKLIDHIERQTICTFPQMTDSFTFTCSKFDLSTMKATIQNGKKHKL